MQANIFVGRNYFMYDPLYISSMPDVRGLVFRRFRGEADIPALVAVHEGCREWDQIDEESPREHVPSLQELSAMYVDKGVDTPDMLIATIDDQVIGYAHVFWRWEERNHTYVFLHLGWILPQWRGKRIGTALLAWAQGRIRELAEIEAPQHRWMFATNVSSTEKEACRLIDHAGYNVSATLSDMKLQFFPEQQHSSLPEGIEIRPVFAEDYRALYQVEKDARIGTRGQEADVQDTPESEEDFQHWLKRNVYRESFDPDLWRIAWYGNQPISIVLGEVNNGIGNVREVSTSRAWKRKGIAYILLLETLHAFQNKGITKVRIITDAENKQGARTLYERARFREVKQHVFRRKSFKIEIENNRTGKLADGRSVDLASIFEGVGAYKAGKIDEQQLDELEKKGCPSCGSCSGMFTANSMNCLMEALGLALPGNGSHLANSQERKALAYAAGQQILALIEAQLEGGLRS
jgi:mycothiol synthase